MFKVYARKDFIFRGIGLYLLSEEDGVRSIATNIEFEQLKEGQEYSETMLLRDESAQALMDQLWDCGIRPTEGTGSAGALAATQKHLEDMRKIAFKYVDDAQTP